MQFEDRVVMSVVLGYTGGTSGGNSTLPSDARSLFSSVGLGAPAPTVDATNPGLVDFAFSNTGNQPITVGLATYYTSQDPPNVPLSTEVLKGIQYVTVPVGTTAANPLVVKLPLEPCTQYDNFIYSVGTTFESGVVTQFTAADAANPGPPNDGGYHTAGGVGTLVSFGQTTDTTSTSGVCPPPPGLSSGSTATIGYWQNPNGQAIIKGLGTTATGETVGQWLVQSLPGLFGSYANPNGVTSSNPATSDAAVAALYTSIFHQNGGPKTLAQAFDLALTTYATDQALNDIGGDLALVQSKGFLVSNLGAEISGTGGKTYHLSAGDAATLGLKIDGSNGGNFTVIQILTALNTYAQKGGAITNLNNLLDSINSTYDIK